jgi:hypothetical protein
LVLATADARADGDPASDVLLVQKVFYPYAPTSPALQNTLNGVVAAASRAHFPIKVALITSPNDLGVVTNLFGQPQKYAAFLDQEISYVGNPHPPLLVVMPNGFGVAGLVPQAGNAVRLLAQPAGSRSNDLARAAISAIPKLAAAAGHPITNAPAGPTGDSGKGSNGLVLAILALGAVAVAGLLILVRARHRRAS